MSRPTVAVLGVVLLAACGLDTPQIEDVRFNHWMVETSTPFALVFIRFPEIDGAETYDTSFRLDGDDAWHSLGSQPYHAFTGYGVWGPTESGLAWFRLRARDGDNVSAWSVPRSVLIPPRSDAAVP